MNKETLISNYYSLHRGELLAFASSRLGDKDEAEDVVQNVFLRLLTTGKLLTEQTMPALVFTICRNLIGDYFRRRAFRHEYEHFLQTSDGGKSSMESVFFAADIVERMERGLARIPRNCRTIYRMHILDGMRVSEISEQTGVKYKTVENRLGVARKEMRSYLRAVV
ncbi:MAG: sigma-70 family RNA polymerase sigma factor [Prevotella sp.]|nr:sigma-70 family RNA polymerase sigma factor [Prevotella sp.]